MQVLRFAQFLANRIDTDLGRTLVGPLVKARATQLDRHATEQEMQTALYRALLYALPDIVVHETGIMWEAKPASFQYVLRRLTVMAQMLLARRGVSEKQWKADSEYDAVVGPMFSIYVDKLAGVDVPDSLVDNAQQGPSKFKEAMIHAQWGAFISDLRNFLLVAGHVSKCRSPEEELAVIKAWYCDHIEPPDAKTVTTFLLNRRTPLSAATG